MLYWQKPILYFSKRKDTLNYFWITSIRTMKILNSLLKKKPTTNYLFLISKYHEIKLSLVFSHFYSFIPRCFKLSLASTLIFRCYCICSNMELFHNEILTPKEIFERMDMIISFFDKCLQTFLNKIYTEKVP